MTLFFPLLYQILHTNCIFFGTHTELPPPFWRSLTPHAPTFVLWYRHMYVTFIFKYPPYFALQPKYPCTDQKSINLPNMMEYLEDIWILISTNKLGLISSSVESSIAYHLWYHAGPRLLNTLFKNVLKISKNKRKKKKKERKGEKGFKGPYADHILIPQGSTGSSIYFDIKWKLIFFLLQIQNFSFKFYVVLEI